MTETTAAEPVREHGRIRRVFDKGYGFIVPDENREGMKDVGIFFHAKDFLSGVFDELSAGIEVTFIRVREKEGLRATRVIQDGKGEVAPEERKRRRRS